MSSRRSPKKHTRRLPKNEWLAVVAALDDLLEKQASQESPKAKKPLVEKNTLVAVNAAYAATLRYYTALLEGGSHDLLTQKTISRLWQKAGAGLRECDPDIAARLKASNKFWTSERTWEKETIQKAWVILNSIRASANVMDPDLKTVHRWSMFSCS